MITRTVTASCDHEGCETKSELNPSSHQVYRDLSDLGWGNEISGDDILIYCPTHAEEHRND